MTIVFISSPYAGEVETNIENAKRYCQFAVRQGVVPLAPHLHFPQFLDDNNERERQQGLTFALALLNRCDELWVFSETVSKGMEAEIAYAKEHKIPIKWFQSMEEVCINA